MLSILQLLLVTPHGYQYVYCLLNCDLYYVYLVPVSRNHRGCRGPTADNGNNLLPSRTVFGCSLTAVEVVTCPLTDGVFPSLLLPSSFYFPQCGKVPCTIFFMFGYSFAGIF